VLKEYADKFRVNPGWLFLTGKKEDTQLIRKKLGLFRDEETNKLKEHNTSFMVGNESTGQWMKRSPFDEPKTLARLLGYTLPASNKAIPNASSQKSYAEAKELPKMSKGEDLFRFRCSACHNLGKDSGLGPGLADVTKKREHAWLKRWLKEPDKMLADKDPIAIDLYNRFNKVKMPNLRLTDDDAESLILYLQSVDKAPTHVH
jgi:protein SCO1/2